MSDKYVFGILAGYVIAVFILLRAMQFCRRSGRGKASK